MALLVSGELEAADRAFCFLADHQLDDGSWYAYYGWDGAAELTRVDVNACAYVALGALQRVLVTHDLFWAARYWPVVERALNFVCAQQRLDGSFVWSIDAAQPCPSFALFASTCSIQQSLEAACRLGSLIGRPTGRFADAMARARRAILERPQVFEDKSAYAMDWYYPVLSGALSGAASRLHLERGAGAFIVEEGARCRSDRRWVTTAETAEAALSYWRAGDASFARRLLEATRRHRRSDGHYLTGVVYPEGSTFPREEVTSYSAAAVLLADDALGNGATAEAFGARPRRLKTRKLARSNAVSGRYSREASASL